MKHFKDNENNIYAFEDDDTKIPASLIPITYEEVDELLQPTEKQIIESQMAKIYTQLDRYDKEAIRPLRAKMNYTSTTEDDQILADIESNCKRLREDLENLKTRLNEL